MVTSRSVRCAKLQRMHLESMFTSWRTLFHSYYLQLAFSSLPSLLHVLINHYCSNLKVMSSLSVWCYLQVVKLLCLTVKHILLFQATSSDVVKWQRKTNCCKACTLCIAQLQPALWREKLSIMLSWQTHHLFF